MKNLYTPFVVCLLLVSYQSNAVTFKMTNAVCESYNETWVEFSYCRLRAVNRYKVLFNVNATLYYPVNDVILKLQLMKRENGYKPWLYSVTFDACQFVRRRNHPLVKLVWYMFKDHSTINHSCPYVGLQRLKDFYLQADHLPNAIPTGDYLLLLTWLFNKTKTAITNVYFTFVEDS